MRDKKVGKMYFMKRTLYFFSVDRNRDKMSSVGKPMFLILDIGFKEILRRTCLGVVAHAHNFSYSRG